MEEYTYVPIAIKSYFDFNKLRPFKVYEPLDALYSTKDAEAFARMRTENKQYKDIVNFFDSRAKAMGMQGVNDLMEKTNFGYHLLVSQYTLVGIKASKIF